MSIRTNPFPYALFTKKLLTVLLLALEIITARKKKGTANWYVGAITNENSCDLPLDLSFLEPGKTYEATLYRDAPPPTKPPTRKRM